MTINWYGQYCFKITAARTKAEPVNIILDPPDKASGLRGPKLEADILLSTLESEKIPAGDYFLINTPGEFDVKDVYIRGINAKQTIIYKISVEDIKFCHLGRISQPEFEPAQLEEIGDVDILTLPVGADPKSAVKIMSQIEPKITLPMFYNIPKSAEKPGKLEDFLKLLGIEKLESLPKLNIKAKDLPKEEEAKVFILEA